MECRPDRLPKGASHTTKVGNLKREKPADFCGAEGKLAQVGRIEVSIITLTKLTPHIDQSRAVEASGAGAPEVEFNPEATIPLSEELLLVLPGKLLKALQESPQSHLLRQRAREFLSGQRDGECGQTLPLPKNGRP